MSDDLASLRASLKAAQDLLRIAPAFFGYLGAEGEVVDCNERALEVINATRQDIIGKLFWETPWWAPVPASAARVRTAVEAALRGQSTEFDIEYSTVGDGTGERELRWVALALASVTGAGSNRVAVTGIDVTDRIHTRHAHETDLWTERHKFEAIVRHSPAAMAVWRGEQFEFEIVNPEYQAIFGDRPLLGKPLLEALPELADQPFPGLLTRVLGTGEPYTGREVLARLARTTGGPLEDRYFDFSYIPIEDASGAPYGVYVHAVDVTDRAMSRRALEASVLELQHERELRERVVAALSHDLRTPLAAARLSAELLIHKSDDPRQLVKATQRIVTNMDRADGMIRDLLDASRLNAGEPLPLDLESHDLRELAQATLEDLTSIYTDRFVLAPSPSIRGHWDGTAVRRIIENLASNGAKYGKARTPVTVRLVAGSHTAEIEVHNEGPAIPVDQQPAMFELFKRLTTASTGTQKGWGIGLSLVAGLARAHGGEVQVRSTPGEGTTFTVRLPLDARVPR